LQQKMILLSIAKRIFEVTEPQLYPMYESLLDIKILSRL
jgi:hypothetical protein